MARAPEVVPISTPQGGGRYETRLYRRAHKSDYDDIIVLAPGWLGSGTLHFAASSLARQGHDVAVVSHGRTSIFRHNQDRSKHVHFTARAAMEATGKRGVVLVGHSNGNQDVHHAAAEALRRQTENPEDKKLYIVRAIGSMAGAGLSGHHINLREAGKQMVGGLKEFMRHPKNELDVVMRSVANGWSHPVLSLAEGMAASTCDVRPEASHVINTSPLRSYVEAYFDEDGVIPTPDDRTDYLMMHGSHLTPVICADTVTEIAEQLYNDNHPSQLQIAQYRPAA